jgi:hypothetical protein
MMTAFISHEWNAMMTGILAVTDIFETLSE